MTLSVNVGDNQVIMYNDDADTVQYSNPLIEAITIIVFLVMFAAQPPMTPRCVVHLKVKLATSNCGLHTLPSRFGEVA